MEWKKLAVFTVVSPNSIIIYNYQNIVKIIILLIIIIIIIVIILIITGISERL
jgi:hypothetical protein